MSDRMGWHPVALSADLPPGSATGTRLAGHEIALWRGEDGTPHAWPDRCPHRGMRLSFGFVRGERLACLYHGWQFDGGGACRHLPAHPDLSVPPGIAVSPYAVCDDGLLLWVHPATPTTAPPACPADACGLRSLGILAPLAALAAQLGGRPPFHEMRLSEGRIIALLHPLSANETMLHALWQGTAEGRLLATCHLAAMRRQIEAVLC